MKVYFLTSLRENKNFDDTSVRVNEHLKKYRYELYEKITSDYQPSKNWYAEWSNYISQCDFVIVEGSYPSTIHIGFETGMILMRGKPVILLYKKAHDPVFINSLHSPRLIKSEYDETNLEEVLDWCLEEIKELQNRRFTFFISPEIENFLDEVADQRGTTRSEFIRGLIENEMFKSR